LCRDVERRRANEEKMKWRMRREVLIGEFAVELQVKMKRILGWIEIALVYLVETLKTLRVCSRKSPRNVKRNRVKLRLKQRLK
jgi:hypothetical protein